MRRRPTLASLLRRLSATWRVWWPPFRQPPEPEGYVDHPGAGAKLKPGTVNVTGWVAFPDDPVSEIEAWLGTEPLGRARLGKPRPDLVQIREDPYAGISGFELSVDLKPLPEGVARTALRLLATSTSGQTHEIGPIEIAVAEPERPRTGGELGLPPRPTPIPSGESRPRVLVGTHQLNLGGAQLYLLDLLRELVRDVGPQLTLVSGLDGPLRADVEELGIPVHISGPTPVDDIAAYLGRAEELTAWASPRGFDVAFINTATASVLQVAEATRELGIPAVWAVHESFAPAELWSGMEIEVRERAESTLSQATRVVFEAEATNDLYRPLLDADACRTIPYGLDLEPIEEERARFDRAAARRRADLPESAEVLLCVGTVEARKAQIPLAVAFERIAAGRPDAHLVIVGAGKNPDSLALENWVRESGLGGRLRLIPVTPDVHEWYAMADLLICASDVESLPRTVLEAMAFETPVLATSVFGLPELIEDGKTGWLCEPRDVNALSAALERVLDTPPESRREVGRAARALVEERHDLPRYAERISKLLSEAIGGRSPDSGRVAAP